MFRSNLHALLVQFVLYILVVSDNIIFGGGVLSLYAQLFVEKCLEIQQGVSICLPVIIQDVFFTCRAQDTRSPVIVVSV